jgi:signal transduction histidine kinase
VWLGINGQKRTLARQGSRYYLFKDKQGNIWYGRESDHSISYLASGTGQPVRAVNLKQEHGVTGAYQVDDTTYYFLTNREIKRIVLARGKVTDHKVIYTSSPGTEFTVLYALDSSRFWIGSDRGLMEFSLTTNKIKMVAGLQNIYVRAAIKLAENNYLLGTYDKGIYQFVNGKWIHLSSREKHIPASAHGFIVDHSTSSLWMSSNEGIVHFSLPQLLDNTGERDNIKFGHFTNFGPDISTEFNGSSNISAAKLSDSCLAFANANGLVTFNPMKLIAHPLPKNILVEMSQGGITDSVLTGKVNFNHIEFNTIIPYFGNRNDLEVLYRLTNSDKEWHKLTPNATISYNNLKPGPHELQFRMKNYSDVKGKEVFLTASKFFVTYRWYQTVWFRIFLVVSIVVAVILLHYFRIWYILQRKRELEQLVKMKTAELQETNENLVTVIDELSLSEANLKQSNFLKDEYYAVLTHDLRSPLKFLSFNISQLLELAPEQKDEDFKKGLFAAYQCSTEVYKLVDEFVYWIQDNEKQLKVQPLQVSVNAIIEDAKKIYELSLDRSSNTFITEVPDNLIFVTDPKLLFIILRNAVDNANKYTAGGTITVSASRLNGELQITVADTGKGISEENVGLLTGIQSEKVQLSYKQRKSLGFYIMAVLTRMLGGRYTITSNREGTRLFFILPELKED